MLNKPGVTGRVQVVINPEFLREGYAFEDTMQPWRIVIGSEDKTAANKLAALYRKVYRKKIPIVITDWDSAELIKLAANVYLAHRLGFIHEIADFARLHKLDIDSIRRGVGLDPRIGLDYFQPGLGFGGSCLPKDCRIINSSESGSQFQFLTAGTALAINDRLLDNLITLLNNRLGRLQGAKIALLGVAFKPQVDDTRNSQAVRLALKLRDHGAIVISHDPYLKKTTRLPDSDLPLESDLLKAVQSSNAIVIGCAHKEFHSLKPASIASQVSSKIVCDYFGILKRTTWNKAGFEFI
jgi:UDPglucose 6-dehydrogenase